MLKTSSIVTPMALTLSRSILRSSQGSIGSEAREQAFESFRVRGFSHQPARRYPGSISVRYHPRSSMTILKPPAVSQALDRRGTEDVDEPLDDLVLKFGM